jgi:hypothetical protein
MNLSLGQLDNGDYDAGRESRLRGLQLTYRMGKCVMPALDQTFPISLRLEHLLDGLVLNTRGVDLGGATPVASPVAQAARAPRNYDEAFRGVSKVSEE